MRALIAISLLAACATPSDAPVETVDTHQGDSRDASTDVEPPADAPASDGPADTPDVPDTGPVPLPSPLDLGTCEIVASGTLPDDTNESSSLAAVPGLRTMTGQDLLVTHGDKGLTLDFVDASGKRDGRVEVLPAGDFEAITVLSVSGPPTAATIELAALESPGNNCTRGEGVCTDGHVVRFRVAAQPGTYALLAPPEQWTLPPKERTNSECLEWTGDHLLLFAKNTADKYRVHFQDGSPQLVLEPLVKLKSTEAQGKLTDLTHDPATGRLLATSITDGGAILVELDAETFEPLHLKPIPPPLAFEKVEGIAVLADQTVAITTEKGSIRQYRCR